jgi:hypothetical protein
MAKNSKKGAQRAATPAATPAAGAVEDVKPSGAVEAAEATEPSGAVEAAEAAIAKAAEKEAEAKRGHYIAEGKSITSKKGIVAAGDKVTQANWDEATFKKLCDSGVIIEVK